MQSCYSTGTWETGKVEMVNCRIIITHYNWEWVEWMAMVVKVGHKLYLGVSSMNSGSLLPLS